ncbi:MAG: hypothetical protein RL141_594 [Candidatus Parcubacteria bacterium]|jgi:hypothetical protein
MSETSAKKNGKATSIPGDVPEVATGVDTKFALARKIIANLKDELANLEHLLSSKAESADLEKLVRRERSSEGDDLVGPAQEGKILEGVFDGQHMVGSDGRQYIVPPNYASKSKLVEGDILKLTIVPNGTFLFKQIGPIERQRVMGVLMNDEQTGDWKVVADGKKYSILTASVTFFKGAAGDDAVILVPKSAPSRWAALENVIKRY